MPIEINKMILGIDASNIRGGGGVTHLIGLLEYANPEAAGFKRVIVWGGRETLSHIADKQWLDKRHDFSLDRSLLWRSWWQTRRLSIQAGIEGCDLLFIPGGSYVGNFRPYVTISQNMLPFEWSELKRYGFSFTSLKFVLLRLIQGASFRRANGLIFLTRYAEKQVHSVIGEARGVTTVIPHGIAKRFLRPNQSKPICEKFSADRPFRILYVSAVDVYKHQDKVVSAVAALSRDGLPVTLDLVGPAYGPELKKLLESISQANEAYDLVRYHGNISRDKINDYYYAADAFVFASSCENLPMILLESMAAGLPIACSDRGPMPEVLGEAGLFFNPESIDTIIVALRKLFIDLDLRQQLAQAASRRAELFSWEACTEQTFAFLAQTVQKKTPTQEKY